MSEVIRCPKCRGLISGQAQHSADMPCACWMESLRDPNESDWLRNQCDDLRSQLAYWKERALAAEKYIEAYVNKLPLKEVERLYNEHQEIKSREIK